MNGPTNKSGNRPTLGGNARTGGSGGGGAGVVVADGVTIDGNGTPASPLSSLGPRAWTRLDIAAPVQNVDIPWAGETGYTVEIIGFIIGGQAAADASFSLQPNAVSTNQVTQAVTGTGAATPGSFKTTTLDFGYAPDPGGFSYTRMTFVTKTGSRRPMFADYLYETAAGASQFHSSFVGRWNDIVTVITSLRIHSNVALGIGAGSYFLYRSIPLQP